MSISFYGINNEGKIVFSIDKTQSTIYINDEDDERPNPNYDSRLDVNFSNRNAKMILDALGIQLDDDEYFTMNAKEFAARCSQWLKKNIGKTSREINSEIESQSNEPTIYHGGVTEGYLNKSIQRLAVFARTVIELGATKIYAC